MSELPRITNGCRGTPLPRTEPFQGAAARPVNCAITCVAGDKQVQLFIDPEKMPRLVTNLDADNAAIVLAQLARAVMGAFGPDAVHEALKPVAGAMISTLYDDAIDTIEENQPR